MASTHNLNEKAMQITNYLTIYQIVRLLLWSTFIESPCSRCSGNEMYHTTEYILAGVCTLLNSISNYGRYVITCNVHIFTNVFIFII